MLWDDAVESIYRGSAAHISTFLWRYAPRWCHWECISRVNGAYLPSSIGLCYAGCRLRMYRRKEKVEEQIPSWRIVVLCAETRLGRRLCAQATYQVMQFRTAFGTDSSLTLGTTVKTLCSRFFALLRMTMYCCSEWQCIAARNDNAELCRGISRYCMKISSEKLTEKFSIFNIFVK